MDWLLETVLLYPRRSIALGAAILLVCAAIAWYLFAWHTPQHAFEDMLANNLSTTSVLRQAVASNANQGVEQDVRLQMGSTNAADWLVEVKQAGSSVTTESIGTPSTGYVRYVDIQTSQTTKDKKRYDFSSVLGKWGKSDGRTDQSLDSLFSQTLFDITNAPTLPIGNLPSSARENILQYIRDEKIFTPDYSKVKREQLNGRSVYTYPVAVQLGAYARMMQAFAHDLGFSNLDSIDPSQYSTIPPITIQVSVDQASHLLARVVYSGSGFSQTYHDWGLIQPIVLPTTNLTTTQLQDRINKLNAL